jgi:hypothetical protein
MHNEGSPVYVFIFYATLKLIKKKCLFFLCTLVILRSKQALRSTWVHFWLDAGLTYDEFKVCWSNTFVESMTLLGWTNLNFHMGMNWKNGCWRDDEASLYSTNA